MQKISIVMSAYNEKEDYLIKSIESILSQTYTNIEFIIVLDNPQNVELKQILEKYALNDKRIKIIINEKNMGLAMSLNRAIESAQGEYIARMDADDIAFKERLERQFEYMNAHEEIDILSINKILIDEDGKEISKGSKLPTNYKQINKVLRYGNIIVHPGVMMKKKSVESIGLYRNFPVTQDGDLWFRAIDAGLTIGILDEPLIYYRINSNSVSFMRAYRQVVIAKYISELSIQRKKNGVDTFSQEELKLFLDKYQVDNEGKAEAFRVARVKFENGRVKIKKLKLISGTCDMYVALSNSLMRRQMRRMIICNFWKSKLGGIICNIFA